MWLFLFQVTGFPGGEENQPCPYCFQIPVLTVSKYFLAFYPTDDNMVQSTGIIEAGKSWHKTSIIGISTSFQVIYLLIGPLILNFLFDQYTRLRPDKTYARGTRGVASESEKITVCGRLKSYTSAFKY